MNTNPKRYALACLLAITSATFGCQGDDGATGPVGPTGPSGSGDPTETELDATQDGPGINIDVISIDGATGLDGTFQVGDTISMTFAVTKDDGSDWDITEFDRGHTLVSGPTFNYQRVIAEKSDVLTASVENGNGTWTYTYSSAIPATYLAPLGDTATFGVDDGELTGQALLPGTYTVGLYFTWKYTVDEETFTEVDNATEDVLFLGSMVLQPREVVAQENCNTCHDSLRVHSGRRRDVTLCLLCHTSGSEDNNTGGLTPDVTVDFKVLIHKVHNGAHLPSVNGIATNVDGSRNYAATPKPYVTIGGSGKAHAFSDVEFPKWPNLAYTMPKDFGYSSLSSGEKAQENAQLGGVTSCNACHGDPDGAGPITAPTQGMQAFQQPTRNACGSCHDDVDWAVPYTANQQTMPANMLDSNCVTCHDESGTGLSVEDAHLHPMVDPAIYAGLNIDVSSVVEAGSNDGDLTFDSGEKVEVTFTLTDDSGADVDPVGVNALTVVLNGPTENLNMVLNTSIPSGALVGAQPFTLNLPAPQFFERLATGTVALDTLSTDYTPLWDDLGAVSTLYLRTALAVGSTLSEDVGLSQNYIDVVDGSAFAKDDYIVVDDGNSNEEYLKIQWVDGDRLWFGSAYQSNYKPSTVVSHDSGETVDIVTLTTLTLGVDYSLNTAGSFTELLEKGNGAIFVAKYTSDFVMPAIYPATLNETPDVTEAWGKWAGKSIADGTYRLGIWTDYGLTYTEQSENNSYPVTSPASVTDILVGSATTIEPYALIGEIESCYACHDDIYFHGGHRRGVDACIQCHGNAGAEDRPQYVAPGADPTTATLVRFREMIHKIHNGSELEHADTYIVNGFGSAAAYPNNFTAHNYAEVTFPAMPGGTKHCMKCHGTSDAWESPAHVVHPTESLMPQRSWREACGSCHDGDAVHAHIDAQTSPSGAESCTICHDDGSEIDVENVHKPRM